MKKGTTILFLFAITLIGCATKEEAIPQGMIKDTVFNDCTLIVPKTWERIDDVDKIMFHTDDGDILEIYSYDLNEKQVNNYEVTDSVEETFIISTTYITDREYPTTSVVLKCTDYDGNEYEVQKMIVTVANQVWDFRYNRYETTDIKGKDHDIIEVLQSVIISDE